VRVCGLNQRESAQRAGDIRAEQLPASRELETAVSLVTEQAEGGGRAHQTVGGTGLAGRALGDVLGRLGAGGEVIGDAQHGDRAGGLGDPGTGDHVENGAGVGRGPHGAVRRRVAVVVTSLEH
jgi:hypothetical protein